MLTGIDDLINLNNPTFHTFISAIYPKELQIKQENTTQDSTSVSVYPGSVWYKKNSSTLTCMTSTNVCV